MIATVIPKMQRRLPVIGIEPFGHEPTIIDLREHRTPVIRRARPRSTMAPASRGVPTTAVALSGWVAVTMFALPPGSTVRFLITWGFMFTCPGLVLVTFARLSDPLERAVYSVAGSGALVALVSLFFVLLGRGSAILTVLTLAVLTTAGALLADPRAARMAAR